MIHQREVNDRVIPQGMMDHWKVLFVKGFPLNQKYSVPLDKERVVGQLQVEWNESSDPSTVQSAVDSKTTPTTEQAVVSAEAPIPETILQAMDVMDEKELESYLEGKQSWAFSK